MHMPSITAAYLAILALLYGALALQVIRLRRKNRAAFNDGGNAELRSAVRAHGNFIEYVPIITLMVAFFEMSGAPSWRIHLLMGALLVSRLLHPIGIYAAPGHATFRIGRVGGMVITITVLTATALTTLWRLATMQ